jgi:hypothetical protein
MEHTKILLLFILFFISGIVFIVAGIIFNTEKKLKSFNDKRALGSLCAFISLITGILTIIFGILIYILPVQVDKIVVIYLILLIILITTVMIVVKNKKI